MNRLDAIEHRLSTPEAALTAKPAILFSGPWRDGQAYAAGSITQCRGSLFIAVEDVEPGRMPGDAEADENTRSPWCLCVRRGRAGKDGAVPPSIERRLAALEQRL